MTKDEDWLQQAKKDFLHAQKSKDIQHYEWSVLAAQQAAEKAIKALYYKLKADAWDHALLKLLKKLPKEMKVSEDLYDAAKYLDKHYITTRYPNGFASGAPDDYYTEKDAKEAIKHAKKIISFCENQISSIPTKANENAQET